MKKKLAQAVMKMAKELAESAVNNIHWEVSTSNSMEVQVDKIMEEAKYIEALQEVYGLLEDDEDNEYELKDLDLRFLKGDFPYEDLEAMVGEEFAEEIWNAIYPPRRKKKVA